MMHWNVLAGNLYGVTAASLRQVPCRVERGSTAHHAWSGQGRVRRRTGRDPHPARSTKCRRRRGTLDTTNAIDPAALPQAFPGSREFPVPSDTEQACPTLPVRRFEWIVRTDLVRAVPGPHSARQPSEYVQQ